MNSDYIKSTANEITSFDFVTLRETGMRVRVVYEIINKESGAEISEYRVLYRNGETVLEPESRVLCTTERVLKLLNDCELISWDGFHGAHPKDVLDGTMFLLEANVNGSRKIRAEGSENFPKSYRVFTNGLYEILYENEK